MLLVAIPALAGTASLGTAGLLDALSKADGSWALATGQAATRLFDVRLVGLNRRAVTCRGGVSLHPSVVAHEMPIPDLVVVPGLDDELDASFSINRHWVPWIARWHHAGARIASSCTGAFLVADAGLLQGRAATTHWLFADQLRQRYPSVNVTVDRMVVDHGDVITSGGATAFLNLVLYLLERFGGRERANLAAKVLLVDGHRPSQLPYVAALPGRFHDDLVIHQIQQYIDAHLDEPLLIGKLAAQFGLSTRTLSRRLATATGSAPQAYLRHTRVQYAKRLLETTSDPIDEIRRCAGYSDPAAFRRAFKQTTSLSPNEYRGAYGPRRPGVLTSAIGMSPALATGRASATTKSFH
ncbi:MAG TPA: helix-turn-helix domain-containing protein [Chloroflexota bacterium]|nr:helix-turn-helix domain-containing protein [Chloroflexota bacterium]